MKTLLAALSMGTVLAGSALAADLPYRKGPPVAPPPPPVFTWTGFYIGGYVGGAFANESARIINTGQSTGINPTGLTAGGLVGYNYQLSQLVLGLEGDIGFNGLKKTSTYLNIFNGHIQTIGVDSSWVGRARGRLGWALGNFLLYGAGGVSFTDNKAKLGQLTPVAFGPVSVSKSLVGWNIGGGLEYAFTPNWIGRAEYIYDDFGRQTYGFVGASGGFFTSNRSIRFNQSTVRGALEYKF